MKRLLFILCAFFPAVYLNAEVKGIPSVNLSLYGGKYYLDGKAASFDAKVDAFASYALSFDENNKLYPVYSGYYNGTQDIQELAGGDVLTRQRMGHTFSFKYVHSKDFNFIKPRISYSLNYINETKDESWGNGLFDYNVLSFGVEFEQERPDATYKESIDFYSVSYPNYASLISEVSTVLDTTTYSELSQNAGTDVLNNRNLRLAFSYIIFPKNLTVTNNFSFTYRDYYDQSVVDKPLTGSAIFKSDTRKDMQFDLNSLIEKNNKKVYMSLGADITYLKSNQNSYDASRTKYIDDYYSYISFDIYPNIVFKFKNGGTFGYSFSYARLNYINRNAQDVNGNYLSSTIKQNFYLNTFTLKYPVAKNIFAKGSYSYQKVDSNMKYEAGYRYNYKAENFLIGIEWGF